MSALYKTLKTIVPAPVRRALRFVQGRVRESVERWRIARFRERVVTHRYGDKSYQVVIADPEAADWYDRDWETGQDNLVEIEFLSRSRLCPGARVFDLGCHQGVVAMLLADRVGSSGTVLAVDQSRHNVDLARRNAGLNGIRNIELLNVALAAETGTLEFPEQFNAPPLQAGQTNARSHTVSAVTVDALVTEYGQPDVIYMDIEGYEGQVIRGATKTLAGHPDVYVEVHGDVTLRRFGSSVQSLLDTFASLGYELFVRRDEDVEYMPLESTRLPFDPEVRFFLVAFGTDRQGVNSGLPSTVKA